MEIDYLNGDIDVYSKEEYIEILAGFIARLSDLILPFKESWERVKLVNLLRQLGLIMA